jgi:hypothetical protein
MDPHGAVSIPLQGFEFVPADAGATAVLHDVSCRRQHLRNREAAGDQGRDADQLAVVPSPPTAVPAGWRRARRSGLRSATLALRESRFDPLTFLEVIRGNAPREGDRLGTATVTSFERTASLCSTSTCSVRRSTMPVDRGVSSLQ